MIQKGQVEIFRMVQVESFNNEVKHLTSKKRKVPSNNSISQLNPFLEKLNNILLFFQEKAVSDVMIQWSHNSVAHGARGLTLNHLRNKNIWIISANAAVRGVIYRCITCRKLRGKRVFKKWLIYQSNAQKLLHSPTVVYICSALTSSKEVTVKKIWSIIYMLFLS